MMKQSRKYAPDPETLALRAELQAAQSELALAYRQFDQATAPELVESCIYRISAAKARCDYYLRVLKAREPVAAGSAKGDLNQKIIAGLLLAFFLITLLRIFRTPLRLALKLLMNTALGFLALWAVNATAAVTGVALGLNLLNALTVGVLGLPGFVLLLLAQWVL